MQLGSACLILPANLTSHLTPGGQSAKDPKRDTREKLLLQLEDLCTFDIFNGLFSSPNFCLATLSLLSFSIRLYHPCHFLCLKNKCSHLVSKKVMSHGQKDLKSKNATAGYTRRCPFVKDTDIYCRELVEKHWKWNKDAALPRSYLLFIYLLGQGL